MGSCSKWGGLGINLIFYCMLYIALWIFFERTGELNSLTHLNILLAVVTILVHSTTLSEALMIRMYLMFSYKPNKLLKKGPTISNSKNVSITLALQLSICPGWTLARRAFRRPSSVSKHCHGKSPLPASRPEERPPSGTTCSRQRM